jgi:hypothetical protein
MTIVCKNVNSLGQIYAKLIIFYVLQHVLAIFPLENLLCLIFIANFALQKEKGNIRILFYFLQLNETIFIILNFPYKNNTEQS